jgi:pSer/pThr/pTyr-binding forkhead associated (FHA) protein
MPRHHALLRFEAGQWVIEDTESASGTFVNGTRITSPTQLTDGDQIRFGDAVVIFHSMQ